LIPAHIAQHYCDFEGFHKSPTFKKEEFSRVLKFGDWSTGKCEDWFSLVFQSGVNFAICRSSYDAGFQGVVAAAYESDARIDLAAMITLSEVRITEDLEAIRQLLQIPLQDLDADADAELNFNCV
jgi:hypothetical protein